MKLRVLVTMTALMLGVGAASVQAAPPPLESPAVQAETASTVEPQAGARSTGSAAGDIEMCLVRNAIVPIDEQNIGAETPDFAVFEYALRSLQYGLLTHHSDSIAAVDRTLDESGAMTGLTVSVPRGAQLDVLGMVREAIVSLPRAYAAVAGVAKIEVRESETSATFADLCAGMQQIMDRTELGGDLTYVGIDPAAGRLEVGSLGSPSGAVAEVREALGGALEVREDTRQVPAAAHRSNDTNGYSAGAGIDVAYGWPCTAGFAAVTGSGQRYLISAGHCAHPDTANGQLVRNGTDPALCPGASALQTIGNTSSNILGTHAIDALAIMTPSADGKMWVGGGCFGSGEMRVAFVGSSGAGATVGLSGARLGQQNGTVTSSTTGCHDFGYWACAIYVANSQNGTYNCRAGDSGGPAFGYYTSTAVAAAGIISAYNNVPPPYRCSYTDMGTILYTYGGTLFTPKPL